jgi:hypothetical protein
MVRQAAPHVLAAIKKASAATGVDFAYMMAKASAESGFDAKAKSHTSSATGLYQFIDKTWLNLVKKYGPAVGLGKYANAIDDNGHVANPAVKQQILALRKDPDKAAMMAAEYTAENKSYMQDQLGPDVKIGATELYLAHFLGAGGATAFLKAYKENPVEQASDLFPKAANANRNVFYDSKTGTPRTLAGIYDFFSKKFGGVEAVTPDAPATGPALVASASAPDSAAVPVDSRRALAQTLATQIASEQAALDTESPARIATIAPAAGQDGTAHETIRWFTPRQLPVTAPGFTRQASAGSLPAGLVSNPAAIMIMARRDMASVHYGQKNDNQRNYGHLNS